MPKITFIVNGQEQIIEAKTGERILQIALDHNIPMEHACGGNGFCTTCMCNVHAGIESLSPRNDREENMGVTDDPYRLSCQTTIGENDVKIEVLEN